MKNVRSSQASNSINFCIELSKSAVTCNGDEISSWDETSIISSWDENY